MSPLREDGPSGDSQGSTHHPNISAWSRAGEGGREGAALHQRTELAQNGLPDQQRAHLPPGGNNAVLPSAQHRTCQRAKIRLPPSKEGPRVAHLAFCEEGLAGQ